MEYSVIGTRIRQLRGLAEFGAPHGDRTSDSTIKLGPHQASQNVGPRPYRECQVQWHYHILMIAITATNNCEAAIKRHLVS